MMENFSFEAKPVKETRENAMQIGMRGVFGKAKEFLASKAGELKKGGMLMLALGSFEISQAQTELPSLEQYSTGLLSGERKGPDVRTNLLSEYKNRLPQSNNRIYSETNLDYQNKIPTEKTNSSLNGFTVDPSVDTLELGTVDARNYSTIITETENKGGAITTKESSGFFSGMELLPEGDSLEEGSGRTYTMSGKTAEEAIVNAMGMISSLENSTLGVASDSRVENLVGEGVTTTTERTVQVSSSESHNVFKNVKAVIKKSNVGEGYTVQILYK